MRCPRCSKEGSVFMYDAQKTDRCGRCSSWTPKVIKCASCGASWCEPCWTKPPAPRKRMPGIADDQFTV